jgi:hypothetical protein
VHTCAERILIEKSGSVHWGMGWVHGWVEALEGRGRGGEKLPKWWMWYRRGVYPTLMLKFQFGKLMWV